MNYIIIRSDMEYDNYVNKEDYKKLLFERTESLRNEIVTINNKLQELNKLEDTDKIINEIVEFYGDDLKKIISQSKTIEERITHATNKICSQIPKIYKQLYRVEFETLIIYLMSIGW